MVKYTKKDIEKFLFMENKRPFIFEKRMLKLKEGDGNAYVEPSSDSMSTLSSDISRAKSENPTDNTFIVDTSSYDSNKNNNSVTVDVNASNPTDASNKITQLTKDSNVKQLMSKGKLNAKVKLNNESINRLRETSVPFTKKELNELLML